MEFQDPKMMTISHVLDDEEEAGTPLPGFRFHPTDEELVSFYLKRKVEKKPFSIEIIKEIDIYKYHPWDLAKTGSVGDKEWYFYCKRGRKYRNSVRPNRVTGTGGFWKATGIDRPIYDSNVVVNGSKPTHSSDYHCIVGLKKSLVYYRGSAGKGTKTDWMMHEFRLPSQPLPGSPSQLPQAEVWTLCRIFKRSRKYTPEFRDLSSKRISNTNNPSECNNERYISFGNSASTHELHQGQHYHDHGFGNRDFKLVRQENDQEQMKSSYSYNTNMKGQWESTSMDHQDNPSNFSSPLNTSPSVYDQEQGDGGSYWEDLSSVVEFAIGEMYNHN